MVKGKARGDQKSVLSVDDFNQMTQIGWFRFMEKIVNNRYDLVL